MDIFIHTYMYIRTTYSWDNVNMFSLSNYTRDNNNSNLKIYICNNFINVISCI